MNTFTIPSIVFSAIFLSLELCGISCAQVASYHCLIFTMWRCDSNDCVKWQYFLPITSSHWEWPRKWSVWCRWHHIKNLVQFCCTISIKTPLPRLSYFWFLNWDVKPLGPKIESTINQGDSHQDQKCRDVLFTDLSIASLLIVDIF